MMPNFVFDFNEYTLLCSTIRAQKKKMPSDVINCLREYIETGDDEVLNRTTFVHLYYYLETGTNQYLDLFDRALNDFGYFQAEIMNMRRTGVRAHTLATEVINRGVDDTTYVTLVPNFAYIGSEYKKLNSTMRAQKKKMTYDVINCLREYIETRNRNVLNKTTFVHLFFCMETGQIVYTDLFNCALNDFGYTVDEIRNKHRNGVSGIALANEIINRGVVDTSSDD